MSPLQEKANASLVGGDVDELVRHHPWLKASIFKGIIDVLGKIESLANDTKPKEGLEGYFNLIPVNDKADGVASGNATPMETDSPNAGDAGAPSGTAEKPATTTQPSFELGEMPVYQFLNSFSKVIAVCIFLHGTEIIP
jgi:E3 ubiquitin-protein ligase HUWE1